MSERAKVLLRDFNRYRNRTENFAKMRQEHPVRDLGEAKGIPAFEKLDAWCSARGIDSRRWVYWLFARTRFRFAPKITNLYPNRKNLKQQVKAEAAALAAYNKLKGTPLLTETILGEVDLQRAQRGESFNPNRDLSTTAEIMKRRYLQEGRPDLCLSSMFVNGSDVVATWGYHPKSSSCVRCPLAYQCAMTLRASVPTFDIMALRMGQITIQQAQIMDGRANHGR